MTGDRHLSNCELVGEGLANVLSVIFGGIPATGAIARTATNIRSGANSSFAGMLHALFILLFMLLMAPLASYIPLALLGAVLVIVAWNMSGFERIRLLLTAQRGDRATMIVTFLLTVFVDLNTAIEVGVVMACLIFMHRMSNTFAVENDITLSNDEHKDNIDADDYTFAWPEGVVSIHISGPLFFGAASRLTEFFDSYAKPPKIVIMRMGSVPMIDASAINILIDFIKKCKQNDARLIISHAKPQPRKNLKREICKNRLNKYVLWTDKMPNALEIANTYLPKKTQDSEK
ncbi:MAG: SulP family inorganic anion transporter [Alphaproteobacteria bacterium]|nr:SulP family inorganic anion transporter [Alphaproteobacteria bacterium]